jgi:2-succinyl-6-hydroxy-2,4-cyclohexadiene-1-carboxylate synthase
MGVDIDAGDGLTLHAEKSGDGPPLVLLHGFTGSSATWKPLVPVLSREHAVVALDMPGHGHSSAPADPGRYALSRFANDLARALDSLELEKIALLGYSMGGRAALQFATSHADRVAALILESTSPGISDPVGRKARVAADLELADSIETGGVSAFVERWESLSLWESQQALPESERARLHAQRLENQPVGLANSLRGAGAGASEPVTGALPQVRAPALIIAGSLDAKYVDLGQLIATSLPNARLSVIDGSGHTVHFEKPKEFAAAVSEFLGTVPAAGSRWL